MLVIERTTRIVLEICALPFYTVCIVIELFYEYIKYTKNVSTSATNKIYISKIWLLFLCTVIPTMSKLYSKDQGLCITVLVTKNMYP